VTRLSLAGNSSKPTLYAPATSTFKFIVGAPIR
jgi:hypothetical protein